MKSLFIIAAIITILDASTLVDAYQDRPEFTRHNAPPIRIKQSTDTSLVLVLALTVIIALLIFGCGNYKIKRVSNIWKNRNTLKAIKKRNKRSDRFKQHDINCETHETHETHETYEKIFEKDASEFPEMLNAANTLMKLKQDFMPPPPPPSSPQYESTEETSTSSPPPRLQPQLCENIRRPVTRSMTRDIQ